jgi:hypothetical protein
MTGALFERSNDDYDTFRVLYSIPLKVASQVEAR